MDKIHVIRTGVFGVNTLIVPLSQNDCFVVDPAACSLSNDKYKITSFLESKKLNCREIVLTHAHFDHITGIDTVKNCFPEAASATGHRYSRQSRNGYSPHPLRSSPAASCSRRVPCSPRLCRPRAPQGNRAVWNPCA